MKARHVLVAFGAAALSALSTVRAEDGLVKDGRSECYSFLTELVRSSNFPFLYVDKGKINLLIDDRQGEVVVAQLVFDTDGSGSAGWIKYDAGTRELFNISAVLEEPHSLHYENKYAEQYGRCINDGNSCHASN
ncbi:hypothetical protein [Pseudomonas sp. PDM22]|uniref:hypothetical protein n=1 Tax=Pseudomonas sp. PDM22 TaxID=2769287 RepID=UPI00111BD299|nr:hypothetical protein [Pseudomonas sp. PDM22]MBD9516105.1 hypothetical protein [Pseudomonas sp. PDM22]